MSLMGHQTRTSPPETVRSALPPKSRHRQAAPECPFRAHKQTCASPFNRHAWPLPQATRARGAAGLPLPCAPPRSCAPNRTAADALWQPAPRPGAVTTGAVVTAAAPPAATQPARTTPRAQTRAPHRAKGDEASCQQYGYHQMFHDGSAWAVILWFRQSRCRGVSQPGGLLPRPQRRQQVS